MKLFPLPTKLWLPLLFSFAAVRAAEPATNEEKTVDLFEQTRATIAVPAGYRYVAEKSSRGLPSVRIDQPDGKVSLQITFFPDPSQILLAARAQKDLMHETFFSYVGTSVEKAMQFEDLEAKVGKGTFCVFTDASLVGKAELPENEFLHVTAGVKAWPGAFAVFSLFSNDTKSEGYRALMATLRESVQERPSPLK